MSFTNIELSSMMQRPCLTTFALLALSLLAWTLASAQTLPSAGSVLRQQDTVLPPKPQQLPAAVSKEVVREATPKVIGDVRIVLKSVRFSGAQGLASEAELQELVHDSLGKELGSTQLQELADKTLALLKGRGWFAVRAYLPEQDLTDGKLEIAITTGRVDGGLKGIGLRAPEVRLSEHHIRAVIAETLPSLDTLGLNLKQLERTLLVLNELPGVSSQASLERGTERDSTRLTVEVKEGPLLLSSVTLDNSGSRYTGTLRGTGQLRVMDPFGAGDQFNFGAVAASGVSMGSVAYGRPLTTSGLGWGVNASAMNYSLGADLENLGLSGSARTAGLSLAYPFILQSTFHLRGALAADFKALVDSGNGATLRDKRLLSWSATLVGDRLDDLGGGGASNFSLALTQGRLDLAGSANDLAADQTGPRANGAYGKFTYALARLQKLPGPFTLFASINGQLASTNLDSSEKFILGGGTGVRAYPGGEGAGDSGWSGSLELRYDVVASTRFGNLQWSAILDTGQVTLNKKVWGPGAVSNLENVNSYALSGAGVGLSLTRAGSYTLRALWTQALGANPGRSAVGTNSDGLSDRSRLVLISSINF